MTRCVCPCRSANLNLTNDIYRRLSNHVHSKNLFEHIQFQFICDNCDLNMKKSVLLCQMETKILTISKKHVSMFRELNKHKQTYTRQHEKETHILTATQL